MHSMQCEVPVRHSRLVAANLAILAAVTLFEPVDAGAQTKVPLDAVQQEADYRVIAARCGTPAFEKAFTRQSRAAVIAGLVSPNREAATVEKSITALRRSPLALVATSTDCPAQIAQLAVIQRQRTGLGKRSPKSAPKQ